MDVRVPRIVTQMTVFDARRNGRYAATEDQLVRADLRQVRMWLAVCSDSLERPFCRSQSPLRKAVSTIAKPMTPRVPGVFAAGIAMP
jgi:hypothetical protein